MLYTGTIVRSRDRCRNCRDTSNAFLVGGSNSSSPKPRQRAWTRHHRGAAPRGAAPRGAAASKRARCPCARRRPRERRTLPLPARHRRRVCPGRFGGGLRWGVCPLRAQRVPLRPAWPRRSSHASRWRCMDCCAYCSGDGPQRAAAAHPRVRCCYCCGLNPEIASVLLEGRGRGGGRTPVLPQAPRRKAGLGPGNPYHPFSPHCL